MTVLVINFISNEYFAFNHTNINEFTIIKKPSVLLNNIKLILINR